MKKKKETLLSLYESWQQQGSATHVTSHAPHIDQNDMIEAL